VDIFVRLAQMICPRICLRIAKLMRKRRVFSFTAYCASFLFAPVLGCLYVMRCETLNIPLNTEASSELRTLPIADTVKIFETSGKAQTNRPVTIPRAFREGEIPNFAQASVGEARVLTQCDVKNQWPDGSLKYALVSFAVPSLPANSSVVVSFLNQTTGNNTGFATQTDLLDAAYDFDAGIEMTGANAQQVSAREMLKTGFYSYWLQGPIVTALIIEDRTPGRSFDKDFGDGSKALHPIFEAWFYPATKKVDVGYTVENIWASSDASHSMRDLRYGLTLRVGFATPRIKFSEPTFLHIGRTRWHKRYWVGEDPPGIRVDHNFVYWTSTHAIPNWNASIRVAKSLTASRAGADSSVQRIEGGPKSIGNYGKDLRQAGASDWIGLAPLWDILYLYSMDDRLRRASLGNADLAGRIPWNFREADVKAGTGHFFDDAGKINTFGRVVSVNARKRVTLSDLSQTCTDGLGADQIKTGPIDGEGWVTTRDHMPDVAYIPYLFSGRYYYLESLQMQAAFIVGWKLGCSEEAYNRQGDEGFLHDTEIRGDAWGFRTLTYAAFISPDGSAEKAYFEDKLLNNIAEWEGAHDVQLDIPAKKKEWNFGHSKRRDSRGISPLGSWADRDAEFVQPPIRPTAKGAASPWEENFLVNALGIARQFGYPTSSLLQFSSRRLINQVLNPATYPEYLEAYRYPTTNAAGKWISTWQEYNTYYDYTPAKGQWRTTETVDHSYGFIAMAALSQLVTFSADKYSGRSAWDFVKTHKPGQDRFATESPKWALVPLNEPLSLSSSTAAEPEQDPTTQERPESRAKQGASGSLSQGVASSSPIAVAIAPVDQGKVEDGTGWFEIPNTKLEAVCPANNSQYAFRSNCTNVIAAWSGGVADQARNRLLIWGGGHNDYFGNEIYALDLNRMVLTRLNDPSPLHQGPEPLPCRPETPDGKANTRHTYGGLSYIAHADRMYVFGGIVACTNGGGSNDTWTLNLDTLQWTRMDSSIRSNPRTINGVVMSDYDPNSKLVFMENTRDFYSYNFDTNSYAKLQFDAREVSYHMSAVIDPNRKLFIMFGGEWDGNGGVKVINIAPRSNYQVQDWDAQTKGCEALRKSAYPGLAYDPIQKLIVGWAGGDSVYLFNPDTRTCMATNYPNGPGAQQSNGTHGRFRYFSKLDAFALVNNSGEDAFLLRVRPSAKTTDSSTK
jgi:hypothetical protein